MLLSFKPKYCAYIVCSILVLVKTEEEDDEPPVQCEGEGTTYKFNDQLYQMTKEMKYANQEFTVPYHVLIVKPCFNSTNIDPEDLDTEHIFQMYTDADISNIALPSMQESSQLREVTYRDAIPQNVWGYCPLVYLYIQRANTSLMPTNWLDNCTYLHRIDFDSVTVAQIRDILDTTPGVETLSMKTIDEIADILEITLFPTPRGREKLISEVEVGVIRTNKPRDVWGKVSATLVHQLASLPKLQKLIISNFISFQLCAIAIIPQVTVKFNELLALKVYNTDTSRVCFKKHILMPNLKEIHLSKNAISEIEFSELYSSPAPKFSLIFDPLRDLRFRFTREDYLSLNDGRNIGEVFISAKLSLRCDCGQSLWLARAMRENLVKITEEQTCTNQSTIESQKCELQECDRIYLDGPCIACRGENYTVIADCRDTHLSELSNDLLKWKNLSGILAPDNDISILPKYLPKSLKLIDVSRNNVWLRSTAKEAKTLFEEKLRKVRLTGNSVVCSCDNEILLKMLQENKDQIEDYDNITCVDGGKRLKDVNLKALCASRDRDAAVLTSVLVALVVVAATLILGTGFYYRRAVQTFLFARGWCLCCIKEEELDIDRCYDVFLSFCHADDNIVVEQILNKLDKEYSVCVHFRDWYPGEMIPTQIKNSIENSRRTLVVLSKNFVKSLWGLLEFRTAYASGLMDGRIRVVMVVLDNVLDEEHLEGEIRSYVSFNTYVKWGDPWFWDKLKFALPHNPRPKVINCQL